MLKPNCLSRLIQDFLDSYRPQRKFAKVMFSQVSVCPQRGCVPHCMLGYHQPLEPGRQPPGPGIPQEQAPSPGPGTPPRTRHPPGPGTPPPGTEHTGRYGQKANGMHPTGMHSCYQSFRLWGVKERPSRPLPSQSIFFIFIQFSAKVCQIIG